MRTNKTTPTHLLGQYINMDGQQYSARICQLSPTAGTVILNWGDMDAWRAANKGSKNVASPLPECAYLNFDLALLDENSVTTSPKYDAKPLAFLVEAGIVTSASTGSGATQQAADPPPQQEPQPEQHTSTSQSLKEENIMAKTAVFDAENQLINVYDSGKAAKAAHKPKDQPDVKFVSEKDAWPEGGVGDYVNKEDLFPPKEVPAKAEGESKPRVTAKRSGPYIVVKADGVRFAPEDPRAAIHAALVSNSSVEDFLAASPEKAEYTSTRGAQQSVTASGWYGYALKRGWIKVGSIEEAETDTTPESEAE